MSSPTSQIVRIARVLIGTVFATGVVSSFALAQGELWRVTGSNRDFGNDVAIVGDLNGDGLRDVVVGHPDMVWGYLPGQVFGLDGRTGAQIFKLTRLNPFFGDSVASLDDDANGDGVDDFLVSGDVTLFSGADRKVLLTLDSGGFLASVDDLDGDGIRDIALGGDGVWFVSSKSGNVIRTFLPPTSGGMFGSHYAVLDDLNQDGWPDLAITDLDANGSMGAWYVYSLKDGAKLKEVGGTLPGEHLGAGVVSLRDVDGDGAGDFAVGASPFAIGQPPGYVSVISGKQFTEIARIVPSPAEGALGLDDHGGDFDGDGQIDFFVSYSNYDAVHLGRPVWAVSTRTLAKLVNLQSSWFRDQGGTSVSPFAGADVDGDAFDDLPVWNGMGSVALLRGGPCFLSSWFNRLEFGANSRSDRGSNPGGPKAMPHGLEGHETTFVAAGFAPNSIVTIDLVADNGRPAFQRYFVALTDANGSWTSSATIVPIEEHDLVFQALGVDSLGNLLAAPLETVQYR